MKTITGEVDITESGSNKQRERMGHLGQRNDTFMPKRNMIDKVFYI